MNRIRKVFINAKGWIQSQSKFFLRFKGKSSAVIRAFHKKCERARDLGKIPWSVQRVVLREEASWSRLNRHRKAFALSRFQRELLFAGEHPVRFSVTLLLLVVLIWALIKIQSLSWFLVSWGTWQVAEQLAYFSTLWTVQATLAALVYPIVIAFVTVFLQRRPAAEAFVHLYILDSGALAAGLSSLSLVLVMTIQYLSIPVYGAVSLPLWVSLDTVWFLLNAILTTYFLFRTIEFLRPEVQMHVIQRYAVSVALPRDVMRLNSFQVLAKSQRFGWIPSPDLDNDLQPVGPDILFSRYGFREGKAQGTLTLKSPSRLVNVRLLPLHLVTASWMRAARKYPMPQGEQFARKSSYPLLTVPIMPGSVYEKSIPLATVDSGPPLAWWQLRLLRLAYVFRSVRSERLGIQVKSILKELEADTRGAAAHSDVEAFERAYESLVSLHELLLGASLANSNEDTQGSWALLPDIHTFPERALYHGWADIYRSIFFAAIGSMVTDTRPVRRLCHLVQHLDGEVLNSSPEEVRESILLLPPLMMYQLGGWWVQRVEEQGVMEHGSNQMVVLRAPLHRVYEEVVSTFAGGWENAKATLAKVPEVSKDFEWASMEVSARLNSIHIQETAWMLLDAVDRGDRTASEWLADVLGKWWGTFSFEQEPIGLLGKTTYLTLEHLKLEWPTLCQTLGITDQDLHWSGGEVEVLQRGVLMAAIKNFWTDIQLLVLELLLDWAQKDENMKPEESLAIEVAVGMLGGKQWRSGGTLSDPLTDFTAITYLEAKVRQYAADGKGRSGYLGRLGWFVERVKRMQRPDMVSSRVYSFSGADDVRSLEEQQLVLLAVLSSKEWEANESLRRQIDIWMSTQYRSIDIIRQNTKDWMQHFEPAADLSPKVLPVLLQRIGISNHASKNAALAKVGVESLRDLVEGLRSDVLAAEPVAPERLHQISQYASTKGFNPTSGVFPLQLFDEVNFCTERLKDFTLTMRQIRKGELTLVEMDQRASNEDQFWSETMANRVGAVVLSDVLAACKTRDLFVVDANTYWSALKKEAERIIERGQCPILILDNATRPEWVWQWQHSDFGRDYPRPDNLRVQRLAERGDSYICNFNEIEVFVAPISSGKSLLLAKEVFGGVSFQEFDPGRYVDATFDVCVDSKLLVDLKLKFSRKVALGVDEVVGLVYVSESNLKY
ncbi:hypothetical protein [Pseudomonas grandcourensis]|uniref:hypothetical protein n=1 Tax=Pseudomonas grandcourensis TaxID=3136736 RepID=UPI003263AB38